MAATVSLLLDFTGGQGAGAAVYITYAQDLDQNFTDLQSTVNQLVAEVTAVSGPNALIGLDIVTISSSPPALSAEVAPGPSTGPFTGTDGIMGADALRPSINGGDASLIDLTAGSVIVLGQRLVVGAQQVTSSGGSGDRYINISTSGTYGVATTAAQSDLDLWLVSWDGADFTSIDERLAPIFLDGDAHELSLSRPDTTAFPSPQTPNEKPLDSLAKRFADIERLLSGLATDTDGDTIGPLVIPGGSAATPGLIVSDGAGVDDPNTGIYSALADALQFSVGGVEAFRIREGEFTATQTQLLVNDNADGTEPGYSFISDPDTGMYLAATADLAFTVGGVQKFRIVSGGFRANLLGSAVGVVYGRAGNNGTGLYFVSNDEAALAGNGEIGFSVTDDGGGAPAIGFYGVTPVAKAAAVAALTDSTGGTANDTVVAVPPVNGSGATTAQEAAIDDNFADLAAKVNAILAILDSSTGVGLMA
jgi:hypothetical protein